MLDRDFRSWVCRRNFVAAVLLATFAGPAAAQESEFAGLIRSKRPDRDSYQAPTLPLQTPPEQDAAEANELPWADDDVSAAVEPASYQDMPHGAPQVPHYDEGPHDEQAPHYEYEADPSLGFAGGMQCQGGCDGGCDSLAGDCVNRRGRFGFGGLGICRDRSQWFGSVELLLMFRSGDTLPILATTSADGEGDGSLPAGGSEDTRVLFGGERVLDDMTAGGRFTIGTWLDDYQCRSLVFRGWGTGNDSFHFGTNSDRNAVIARPFLNVAGATPVNDSLLISSPDLERTGSLAIDGSSEVYGGDVALRHRWLSGLGGVVEVLYGYQHMQLREDLNISSSLLDPPNAVDVRDRFAAENEFHGGQIGLAARHREGCWSFNGLVKVAAGSLRRTANLSGSTTIGPPAETTPEGLLVRSSNAGESRDSTFGWIPELDATLGYRYTRNLDFTIGYHLIAMTDALQVSGMIDPQLAVNSDFPNGTRRPAADLRFDTFHLHGIHFGLQCVY